MPNRNPPIRIMKRDIQEYKRLRTNYRAKLYRIRRKTNFSLPSEEIDKELGLQFPRVDELAETFKDRKTFNQFKQRVEEVTERTFKPLQIAENKGGMRYPNLIKEFGYRESRKAQKEVDRQIKRYEDLPLIIDGEERGTVGDSQLALTDAERYGIYRPPDFDIDDYIDPQSVEKRIEKDRERQTPEYYDEKKQQMQDNFVSIFDGRDGVPPEIAEKLKLLTPDEFYEMYLQFPDMNFEDWDSDSGYHITGDEGAWYYKLEQYLDMMLQGQVDTSLSDIG